MKHNINNEIVKEIIELALKSEKKGALESALNRNYTLTSEYDLPHATLAVYKEGFYLTLDGTRCSFSVFAKDNDGKLELVSRKPNENKLNKLYTDRGNTYHCYSF